MGNIPALTKPSSAAKPELVVAIPRPNATDVVTTALTDSEQQARFDRYIAPEIEFVERITRRMSLSKSDAEDLAQEVLTNAFRAIAKFDGRYPRAWLYRIASNAAASRARRKKVTLTLLDSDQPGSSEIRSDDAGPEDIVIDPVVDPVLTQALDGLPIHYREVVDLVDLDGMSYEAAASELHIPTGTVMSRLHRGRRRLREELAGTHLDRARSRDMAVSA
jgi:RNA polymerase sigma-70 factor (ECF subfamily)